LLNQSIDPPKHATTMLLGIFRLADLQSSDQPTTTPKPVQAWKLWSQHEWDNYQHYLRINLTHSSQV